MVHLQVSVAIKDNYPELMPGRYGEEAAHLLPLDFPDHKSLQLSDLPVRCGAVVRREAAWCARLILTGRFSRSAREIWSSRE